MAGTALKRVISLLCWLASADNTTCSRGGLTLLQKLNSVQRLTVEVESDFEWVAVDGGQDRACRGANAGDNRAEYFNVSSGLANLGACQALCESTANCKGVEYHTSGRCEIWTRAGGIESSISLSGYSCYALQQPDFIPVDASLDRACRGDYEHMEAITVSSLAECKERCRRNVTCKGLGYLNTRCELWTIEILSTSSSAGSVCLQLEFAAVEGADRACRGGSASDNNPAHYSVATGASSEPECKQACRGHAGCKGIEYSSGRCEVWTREEGIQATVPLQGFKCLAYYGAGTTLTTTVAVVTAADRALFLIQATFGPTLASLQAMGQSSFKQWIDEQMKMPIESHREYYRRRANPYLLPSEDQAVDDLAPLARARCELGSRWVGYSFQKRDLGKSIQVNQNEIFVDGLKRTDIDPNHLGNGLEAPLTCTDDIPEYWQTRGYTCQTLDRDSLGWSCYQADWRDSCRQSCFDLGHTPGMDCSIGWPGLSFTGYICAVKGDEVGAWVQLATSSDCTTGLRAMVNPHVWRAAPSPEMSQSLNFSVFRQGVLHLSAAPAVCNLGTVVRSEAEGAERFYYLEPRLRLVQNTMEEPASSSSWGGSCPAVSKTFLNEGSCKLLPGCLPLGTAQVQVLLDTESFRQFFQVGGRYVFAIKGLRTSVAPCQRRSRWRRLDCATESCVPSSLGADDLAAVQGELSAAEGWLRDVDIECGNVPAQAVVEVGSEHFQHTHLDEFNVYDFTDWVYAHPGGQEKITQWTNQGYELQFPSWHGMDRWDEGIAPGVLRPNLVGRYKESLEFQALPQPLQTQELKNVLATPNADSSEYSMVCGSPGEIENEPSLGHQLSWRHQGEYDWHFDMDYHSRWGADRIAKASVWTMHALYAQDQLRQRMAWALSQILVTAASGGVAFTGETEMWTSYYDIFVRNAFGNFRDVLREVTYNPIMGNYLTFKRNRAFDASNNYPDENFAREIMQLFTIGLWKLNPDGTRIKDTDGNDIPTYSNEHIMNFARVFTGFDEQPGRDNMEFVWGRNFIDPMKIQASWHDVYPKPDLDGNFLGDGYPLCSDLPPGYFLLRGAKYEFLGHTYTGSDVLNLNSSSQLFAKLCGGGAPCKHSLVVELDSNVNCSQGECEMDTVSVVNVSGGLYRYVPPACVNLFFFNGQVTRRGGRAWGWTSQCHDPHLPVAGTACCGGCKNRKDWWWLDHKKCSCANATTACPELFTQKCNNDELWREHQWCRLACWEQQVGYEGDDCSKGLWRGERACGYPSEFVRFKTAQKGCDSRGLEICWERLEGYGCGYDEERVWTPERCSYEVIVHADGQVSSNLSSRTRQNSFYVPWKGDYPKQEAGACPAGCKAYGLGCSCNMTVETRSLFQSVPSGEELQNKAVRIGSYAAHIALTSSPNSVNVYGALGDPETTFEYQGKLYKNKESVVKLGSFEFRNPPVFVTLEDPKERDAHLEVESLLDHLFYHPNTASFISQRLIQRFTSSNPSPGYVKAVADAFRTGAYEGTALGAYGDLGATIMAILLHPEARSQTSATNGALREPLIKVMHVMRSMEYKDSASRNIFFQNLMPVIGQFPYASPSVFNFYLPEFKPSGFPEGHVGPEFEIFTPPIAIRFMNGLTNLIDRGLGDDGCGGFGFASPSNCSTGELHLHELECLGPTIDQMDLLLTGGRLHDTDKIRGAYQSADGGREYKMAQMAMVLTPEFHTLGSSLPLGPRTPVPPVVKEEPRSYKALVMIFMSGGADTYNMLVPMNCPLYDEYTEVRGPIALAPSELNVIQTEGQACADFGIHTRLSVLKELYDSKEMAFLSNIGALVEPLSKEQWESAAGERCNGLFSHSDQQQAAQTLTCQYSASAEKGAGGRMADALASGSQKFRTMSFSVAGMSTWSQGKETAAEIVDEQSGTVSFDQYERLKTVIDNITSVRHGNIYAEEFSSKFANAIAFNQELAAVLKDAKLKTSFPTNEIPLARQLKQVARLISARGERGSERDVFYVEIGGWDTHASLSRELNSRFQELNSALTSFVNELKAQEIFDSTTVVTHSDFARTLTPNSGEGSDHAWGGNYFMLGGAVRGGRVYNDFPASFKEGSTQDAGRGRLIPKYPWENMMLPVAEWMGLDADQVASVFPNIAAFNSSLLLSSGTLFIK